MLLTVAEVAERLRCSRWTIYDLVNRGRLRPARLTSRLLFTEEQVEAAIAASMAPSAEACECLAPQAAGV